MAESVIQTSLAAGEISPNLWARVDLEKYSSGARLLRNFFVDYRGGASSRPGTMLCDRTKYTDKKSRLLPFVFSQEQSYALEFGDLYIRFFYNGAAIVENGVVIIAVSNANPGVVNAPAHGYSTGQDVYISGCTGMFEINDRTYRVVVIDANNFSIWDLDGNPIDTSGYNPYTGGGHVYRVYELTSPYLEADLPLLKYTQSADVMTLTHPDHPPYNLSRLSATVFSLDLVVIGPSLPATTITSVTPTGAGNLRYGYVVVPATEDGELGEVSTVMTCDSVALDPTNAAPKVVAIDWAAVTGAVHYHIYKWGPVYNTQPEPTIFGYIGQTTDLAFTDTNIAPDFSNGPPEFRDPFSGGKNPGCVTYYMQRRVYGGLVNAPQELDMSKIAAYDNFDVSVTVNATDAIKIALASRQVNDIKSMVSTASGLIVLTSGGAFQISGGSPTAAITPDNITALPQASPGANDLPPIVVNYDILFVQSKGAIVRDLAYNFYLQTFYGFDRSALANHLFFGKQLLEWTYAEEPFKIVWAVRNDGKMLSLTYVPEQEVYGWARHDTQGIFESVCSIPEGQEDTVYTIVKRPTAANTRVRYVERMASRKFIRAEDAWCVDCGVNKILDRPNFGLNMSANATQAFIQSHPTTPVFDASWLNKIIWFDVGGKLRVVQIASINQIICDILEPIQNFIPNMIPPAYDIVEAGDWEVGAEYTRLTGLEHLTGMSVEVLADGNSVGPLTVDAFGGIDIPRPASKILAGLGYQCQLQTLYLDVGEPTIQGKRKKIAAVTLRVDQSRAIKVGYRFDDLYLCKDMPAANYTPPISLYTGDIYTVINSSWNVGGELCVQQDFPLPVTILGLIPEVTLGDT